MAEKKLSYNFVVLQNYQNNHNNPKSHLAQQGKPQSGFAHVVSRIWGCFSVRGAVATGGCGLDRGKTKKVNWNEIYFGEGMRWKTFHLISNVRFGVIRQRRITPNVARVS